MEWLGAELYRPARWSLVRQAWNVIVRLGSEGYGVVKQGRLGGARFGNVRFVKAGMARLDEVRSGPVGSGRYGNAR